jgi:hypothetical protein
VFGREILHALGLQLGDIAANLTLAVYGGRQLALFA